MSTIDKDMLIKKYINPDIEKFHNSDVKIVLENLKQNILKMPSVDDSTRINELRKEIEALCDNCDRPNKEEISNIILSAMVFGFGVGSKEPSADRPQGEWIIEIDANGNTYGRCPICGMKQYAGQLNFCPDCGARMKGADDD